MKKTQPICFLCLLAVACLLFNALPVSAVSAETVASLSDEFPLEAEMCAVENGVVLSSLSDTAFRFTDETLYTENRDNITFSLYLRLKDEFQEACSSFKVEFGSGTSELMATDYIALYNEELCYDDLTLDTSYQIQVTLTRNDAAEVECPYTYYIAHFACGVDIDGRLVVDLTYVADKTGSATAQSRAVGNNAQTYYEASASSDISYSSDNGSEAKAVTMTPGCVYRGYIEAVYDLDYFKFVAPCDGYADLMLLTPGMRYATWIKSATGTSYGDSNATVGTPIFLRVPIVKNTTYYVAVCDFSNGYTNYYRYTLQVNVVGAMAWYSQMHGKYNGTYYWNTAQLDLLYFSNTSTRPFMVDSAKKGTGTDYMYEGCGLASFAMVLRNMGASLTGYDFRTGYTGELMADPYTVMLANVGKNGTGITTTTSPSIRRVLDINGANPIKLDERGETIAKAFGKKYERKELTEETTEEKAAIIAATLANHPEGIVAYQSDKGHFVVIGGDNGGTNYNTRFIMYDPGTASATTGNGVPFNTRGASFANVTVIYYFDDSE